MLDLENKNNRISFFLIVLFLGPFGVHWFIQKDTKKGVLYLITFGGLLFAWMKDVVKAFVNIYSYNPVRFLSTEKKEIYLQQEYEQKLYEVNHRHEGKTILKEMEQQSMDFNKLLKEVQEGLNSLESYLSNFKVLLDKYEQMEELNNNYSLNVLKFDRNQLLTTFTSELNTFINKKIAIIFDKHSFDNDEEKSLKEDLIKLRNDVIEFKHDYSDFYDILQDVQFRIEDEMNK